MASDRVYKLTLDEDQRPKLECFKGGTLVKFSDEEKLERQGIILFDQYLNGEVKLVIFGKLYDEKKDYDVVNVSRLIRSQSVKLKEIKTCSLGCGMASPYPEERCIFYRDPSGKCLYLEASKRKECFSKREAKRQPLKFPECQLSPEDKEKIKKSRLIS